MPAASTGDLLDVSNWQTAPSDQPSVPVASATVPVAPKPADLLDVGNWGASEATPDPLDAGNYAGPAATVPQQATTEDILNSIVTRTPAQLAKDFGDSDEALVSFFNTHEKEIEGDPIAKQRIVDTFKSLRQQPFSFGKAVGGFLNALWKAPKSLGESAYNVSKDIVTGNGDRVLQAFALSGSRTAELLDKAGHAFISDPKAEDDEGWTRELYRQSAWQGEISDAAHGHSAFQEQAGVKIPGFTDADAEKIQTNSAVADLVNFLPVGGALNAVRKGGQIVLLDAAGKVLRTLPEASIAGRVASVLSTPERLAAVGGKVAAKLAEVTRAGASTVLEATGRTLQKGAEAVNKIKGGLPGIAVAEVAASAHGLPGAGFGATVVAPHIAERLGKSLVTTGLKLRGAIPPGPIWKAASALVNNQVTQNAARGAAGALGLTGHLPALGFTAVNVAANLNNPEQLGAALGAQAGLGATIGGGAGAFNAVKPYFDIAGQVLKPGPESAPVSSPAYGTIPRLDTAHEAAIATLDPAAQNAINAFREAVRGQDTQIYVVDPKEYGLSLAQIAEQKKGSKLTTEELNKVLTGEGTTSGVFVQRNGKQNTILLNSDGSALQHEGGHVLFNLLPEESRNALIREAQNRYTPDELAEFRSQYEKQLGQPIDRGQLIEEVIAENLSAVLNSVPVETLGTPKPFARSIYQTLGKFFENVGIPITGERTTDLGLRPDIGLNRLAENVVRAEQAGKAPTLGPVSEVDLSKVPVTARTAPATPTAPQAAPQANVTGTPQAKGAPATSPAEQSPNIRVTRQDQNRFQRTQEQTSEAAAAVDRNPNYGPKEKANFIKLGAVIEQGGISPSPVEIEHASVRASEPSAGRAARRGEQEEGYLKEALGALPEDVRSQVQKVLIPERFEVRSGDKVQIVAKSLDKVIANAYRLVGDANAKKISNQIPYESVDGKLTPDAWKQLVSDIQTYTRNQANGYAGNGKPVIIPKDYKGDVPLRQIKYSPVSLEDAKAQFINALMALPPPKTTAAKGKTESGVPANVSARKLAEANQRPVLPSVTSKPGKNFYDQYGVEIAEFNPLRDSLAKAGVDVRDLIEVTERIGLENIKGEVKVRSDLDFSRPSTDLIRAGFKPKAQFLYEEKYKTKTGEEKTQRYFQTPGTPDTPRGLTVTEDMAKSQGFDTSTEASALKPIPEGVVRYDGTQPGLPESMVESTKASLREIGALTPEIEAKLNDQLKSKDQYTVVGDLPGFDKNTTTYGEVLRQKGYEPPPASEVAPRERVVVSFKPKEGEASQESFTKEGVKNLLEEKNWAILTAENPNARELSAKENSGRNAQLRKDLELLGRPVIPVKGHYGREENSYAVVGITKDEALQLGKKYGQESVLTPEGLVYQDGSITPATGLDVHTTKPDDFYSTLPDGTTFSVNLDFENKTPAPAETTTTSFKPKPAKDNTSEMNLGANFTEDAQIRRAIKLKAKAKADNFPEALPVEYQKNAEGKIALDEDGKPKSVKVEYGLEETPLAKEAAKGVRGDARSAVISDAYASKLVDNFNEIKKNPAIMAGSKWYQVARTKIKAIFGDDTLLFAQLLGATSARTPVADNFKQAVDAYRNFKDGKYDAKLSKFKEGLAKAEAGTLLKESGKDTDAAALEWWIDKHDLLPRKSNGQKFNANSLQVLRVLSGIWEKTVGGPKTPNFAGNLAGTTLEATIDVWAARNLRRLGFSGSDKPWRILPESETGVNDTDFYLGQDAYRKAAKQLGMNPDDLQGVLWFAEKQFYEDRGWTRGAGAEKSDFNTFLARTKREGNSVVLAEPTVEAQASLF